MARRRKAKRVQTRTRTVYKKAKSRRRNNGFLGMSKSPLRLFHMGYGIVRTKLANVADPVLAKIPGGEYADEVGLGLMAWLIGKKFKATRKFSESILDVENYRVGELMAGSIFSNNREEKKYEW